MEPNRDLLHQTAQIVSSHLLHSPIESERIPALIREVYSTLNNLGAGETLSQESLGIQPLPAPPTEAPPNPAVPITKSVFPDYIVCLEDGKRLKMLKRHLWTSFQMTPEAYRKRWGLPDDYPMVAPVYARTRSSLAKQIGLGLRRSEPNDEQPAAQSPSASVVRHVPEGVSGRRKRGRPRKVAA